MLWVVGGGVGAGVCVGTCVGVGVGLCVGCEIGPLVGPLVGPPVGALVGAPDGAVVGALDGGVPPPPPPGFCTGGVEPPPPPPPQAAKASIEAANAHPNRGDKILGSTVSLALCGELYRSNGAAQYGPSAPSPGSFARQNGWAGNCRTLGKRPRSMHEQFASRDPYTRIAAAVLRLLFRERYARRFSIRLWDGTEIPAQETSQFTFVVKHPGALRTAFKPPVDLNAGRAFAAGLLDIEGDVEAAVDEMMHAIERPGGAALLQLMVLLRRLPVATLPPLREAHLRGKRHSLQRDRAAIGFHYDQPVGFYQTFLDRSMVYSCAYFDEGIETIDDAQRAKIDHSLRKLRLLPGERLLDIGCGWGALVVRAAKEFGAYVLGVTLSERQEEEARRRIGAEGLEDRARVERWDYRQLPATTFDKIVSIGMVEHVGRDHLPEYFRTAYRLLKAGGLFLNHGIAHQNGGWRKDGKAGGFIERFIFPDGELVSISDSLQVAERAGFEVRDVENLREHYTKTLRAWVANLERNRDRAVAEASEQSYNAWRLYMAASAQGFRSGRMGLYQSLLAKPPADGRLPIPETRRDLYRSP